MVARWSVVVVLVGCAPGEWVNDPAEVEAVEAEAALRQPGDLSGTLECALPLGDVEVERTCDGLLVTSCTDQVRLVAAYPGGWLWTTALSGTDTLVPVPYTPFGVRVRTVSGAESFVLAPLDCTDGDGDGYVATEDCDDADAAVHPGAAERCNGVDDDCDPVTDEAGTASTFAGGVWTDATASLAPGFAVSVPSGTELHVCAGTWQGTVSLQGDGAALRGHPDAASVTVDAQGSHALSVTGGGSQSADDVTLTGATEGGVYCQGSTVALHRSRVVGNSGSYGGGVFGIDCQVFLEDGAIDDNVGADAGAVYLSGGDRFEARGSSISGNRGNVGGALLLDGDAWIVSSIFDGNTAFAEGRDLWVNEGSLDAMDSDFGPNSSAGDTSAVNLRYVVSGQGAYSAHYGAGTYNGSPIGLGRDFTCSTTGANYACYPILP